MYNTSYSMYYAVEQQQQQQQEKQQQQQQQVNLSLTSGLRQIEVLRGGN